MSERWTAEDDRALAAEHIREWLAENRMTWHGKQPEDMTVDELYGAFEGFAQKMRELAPVVERLYGLLLGSVEQASATERRSVEDARVSRTELPAPAEQNSAGNRGTQR
jgi:hypothetical protein